MVTQGNIPESTIKKKNNLKRERVHCVPETVN